MFTRADKFLIITLIVLSVISYPSIRYLTRTGGLILEIEVMGEPYCRVDMEVPGEIVVPGRLGDSVIKIDKNGARFIACPASDKGCIEGGYINDPGETIECTPNGVVISIVGIVGIVGGDKPVPDFITR